MGHTGKAATLRSVGQTQTALRRFVGTNIIAATKAVKKHDKHVWCVYLTFQTPTATHIQHTNCRSHSTHQLPLTFKHQLPLTFITPTVALAGTCRRASDFMTRSRMLWRPCRSATTPRCPSSATRCAPQRTAGPPAHKQAHMRPFNRMRFFFEKYAPQNIMKIIPHNTEISHKM